MLARLAVVTALSALLLGGCARPPAEAQIQPIRAYAGQSIAANAQAVLLPAANVQASADGAPQIADTPAPAHPAGMLAGRVLTVASVADIQLRPGEVILTFDDGPRPGRTDRILDTLDQFGVKATFLMTGQSAEAHPHTAQEVALRGHTIGTHTYDHSNLSELSVDAAQDEIDRGKRAVIRVLAAVGEQPDPFFRFPYLARTSLLRTSLSDEHLIDLGVDIDSDDYFNSTPAEVIERTLRRVREKGRGIILFHDIHQRTVDMLPDFLSALEREDFHVVTLRAVDDSVFGRDIVAQTTLRPTL
jgi:peptidoglycan-N-acetylglucosamine deacetylase